MRPSSAVAAADDGTGVFIGCELVKCCYHDGLRIMDTQIHKRSSQFDEFNCVGLIKFCEAKRIGTFVVAQVIKLHAYM